MDEQKENALDGRKEFDWAREFTLEDDTLPQKQVIVSTILAALSGLRTARAKYILKIVNGWIEDRSYVLVSKEAEAAYAPKVFLTKDASSEKENSTSD